MKHVFLPTLLSVLLMAAVSAPARGQQALKPGGSFSIEFPEMPPTFFAVFEKKDVKARMTIHLPDNYDTSGKFPLLIFLNGWDGGDAGNPGVARALSGGRDFVCVSVPLFKAAGFKVDKANTPGERFVMDEDDGKFMWPLFRKMLDRLDETVPNIDKNHCVLGGFSNGAHATAGLIDQSDGEVGRRFSAFLFVEGGGRLQHYEMLKGKPFLMVSSNSKSKPRAQQICDAAKSAGAKAELLVEDVGKHDFPVAAYPAVRAWLRAAVKE